ncbi:MAG: rhodanese [Bryobacteraceae bacterium]|nr:rhodanese [Bryobacteraceae bacterium]
MLALEISAPEVKSRLDAGEKLRLLDCREPHEWQCCRIEGATLIPMNTIPVNLQQVESLTDDDATIVVYCHHGVRSMNVAHWLRQQGIERVQSMAGGIDHWSLAVDPQVPRY